MTANVVRTKLLCLFVALSLSVTYFYIIRPLVLGRPNDTTNLWVFSAMSKSNPHVNSLYPAWRSRVAGLWISGQLMDGVVRDGHLSLESLQNAFGMYHSVWLFLFFAMLILLVDDPLFAVAGTFACMFYMFTPKAAFYSYPWDIPAMLFFTLNYLLWRKGHYLAMLAAMFIGYLFKETIVLSGVLYFFTNLPKRHKVTYLVSTVGIALLMKIAITLGVEGRVSLLTNQFTSGGQHGLFMDSTFVANLKQLVTPSLNHLVFVNGGTLVLALLLPMRNRIEQGTKTTIALFFLSSMLAGSLAEYRIFLDIVPISLLALKDYLHHAPALCQSKSATAGLEEVGRRKQTVGQLKKPQIASKSLSQHAH